jgi:hypothetical protein
MTTGQLMCYRTGRIKISRHRGLTVLSVLFRIAPLRCLGALRLLRWRFFKKLGQPISVGAWLHGWGRASGQKFCD